MANHYSASICAGRPSACRYAVEATDGVLIAFTNLRAAMSLRGDVRFTRPDSPIVLATANHGDLAWRRYSPVKPTV